MTLQQELDELLKIEESTPEQLAKIEELKASIAEEEVQKKIQSEADKVRSKYAKELKEMQDKLKAIEDAKLTEEEKLIKEKAEKEKLLAEREAQLLKKELDFDSLALLAENNLDKSFLNFLTGQTIDERKEQLNVLKGHIDLQIQEAIKSKLGTDPAPGGNPNKGLKVTKEEFAKMSYAERTNLFLTDPELYNKLK